MSDHITIGKMVSVGDGEYVHIDMILSMEKIDDHIRIEYKNNTGFHVGGIDDPDGTAWKEIQLIKNK